MDDQLAGDFVLGIDLGSNSVGWALLRLANGKPCGIIRQGSRVFDAAYENYMQGEKEHTSNVNRRDARHRRRQSKRKRRRIVKVFHILQRFGLLPPTDDVPEPFRKSATWVESSDCNHRERRGDIRQDYFNWLDKTIRSSPWFVDRCRSRTYPEPDQTLPYILRAAACDEPLEPYFVGRALYHLAQRRGFLSNRVRPVKEDEEEGVVASEISELKERMRAENTETLGHFFAGRSPAGQPLEVNQRIRRNRTERRMYKDEFPRIWQEQEGHHADLLTEECKKQLHRAIFYQRGTRQRASAIGWCELEPGRRRARAHLLISQRYRLLQKVNDLRISRSGEPQRDLTREERGALIYELERRGDLKFSEVRDILSLKKSHRFNLQSGGESKMPGNRTASQLYKVFGDEWLSFSDELRQKIVGDVHSILSVRDEDDRKRRATLYLRKYGRESAAEDMAKSTLEGGHLGLSGAAMYKLMPFLERGVSYGHIAPDYRCLSDEIARQLLDKLDQGLSYQEARKGLLPDIAPTTEPLPMLPPARDVVRSLLNPVVMRVLTEMRKVVNAVIRRFGGKPLRIYIELARDLNKSKEQRETMAVEMRANEAARRKARGLIEELTGDPYPSREDIRKVQLFDAQSNGLCPYCLHHMGERSFLGSGTEVDHIIPRNCLLDDSFLNVVLCHTECNGAKGDQTPFQAFSGKPDLYAQMLKAVSKFSGKKGIIEEKLRRFKMDGEELEKFVADFSSRQLNDTRYASRAAAEYLGLLYGGKVGSDGKQHVFTTTGKYTSLLRNIWNLNSILKDGETNHGGWEEKKRADYRHHAIDALVIALTTKRRIDELMEAVRRAQNEGKRRPRLDDPWPGFLLEVRQRVNDIVVSHRVSTKVSGALHQENFYWARGEGRQPGLSIGERRIRKPVDRSMTRERAERIVDAGVRKAILEKLDEHGGDAKKFSDPKNLPSLGLRGELRTPIKSARIADTIKTFTFGEGDNARAVKPARNHHLEIYAETDSHGNEKRWKAKCVTMIEAYRRLRAHEPVVQQEHGSGTKFKFTIAPTEVLRCDGEQDGKALRGLFVVKSVSQEEKARSIKIEMVSVSDARPQPEIKKAHARITKSPNELFKWGAKKVVVSPLGEVSEAHG